MKTLDYRMIRRLGIAAIIFGALSLLSMYYDIFSGIWWAPETGRIVWMDGRESWQITIMSGYLLSWTLAFAVFCVVVVRIIRALRRGEMFPRNNVRRIFVIAGLLAAGIFFSSNVGNVMHGRNLVTIDTGSFFWPILCIIFALLYRQAAMAAEDSRLTI